MSSASILNYRESLNFMESLSIYTAAIPFPVWIIASGIITGIISIHFVQKFSSSVWLEWWKADLGNDSDDDPDNKDIDKYTISEIKTETKKGKKSIATSIRKRRNISNEKDRNATDDDNSYSHRLEDEEQQLTEAEENQLLKVAQMLYGGNQEEARRRLLDARKAVAKHLKTGVSLEEAAGVSTHRRIVNAIVRRLDLIMFLGATLLGVIVIESKFGRTITQSCKYWLPRESALIGDAVEELSEWWWFIVSYISETLSRLRS